MVAYGIRITDRTDNGNRYDLRPLSACLTTSQMGSVMIISSFLAPPVPDERLRVPAT